MDMKKIHSSMERLYASAQQKGVIGQSAVAHALNLSPQRVSNWEKRGISEQGARLAQNIFGCDVNFLLGSMLVVDESHPSSPTSANTPNLALSYDKSFVGFTATVAREDVKHDLYRPRQLDRQTSELVDLFNKLDANGKAEHLSYLKGFIAGRPTHQDGQHTKTAKIYQWPVRKRDPREKQYSHPEQKQFDFVGKDKSRLSGMVYYVIQEELNGFNEVS